jgi:hypothetical protein
MLSSRRLLYKSSTSTAAPTTINEEEGQQQQELPATFEAALEKVKQMRSTRDKLQTQIDKDNKAIEKLQKNTRLAELKSLVSRQLFRTEDKYNEELEKVYSWKVSVIKILQICIKPN